MSKSSLPQGWKMDLVRKGDKEAVFYPIDCEVPAYSIRVDIDEAGDERDQVLDDLARRLGREVPSTKDSYFKMLALRALSELLQASCPHSKTLHAIDTELWSVEELRKRARQEKKGGAA